MVKEQNIWKGPADVNGIERHALKKLFLLWARLFDMVIVQEIQFVGE